jgi:peptidyl-dipeptidase Dcp
VYIWAAVLDSDGYEAFRQQGIFDPQTARLFRQHILEQGGKGDPMTLYKAFRGREPEIDPLLRERGLFSADK